MIKMVVFDMAGTVIDESNVVYKTLLKAIQKDGYHLWLDQVLAVGAGKEKFQAIKDILYQCLKIEDNEIANSIFNNFKIYLEVAYDTIEIKSQPGAEKVFDNLRKKGIYVVLNTGYDSETAHSILRKVGWTVGTQFDLMVTASDVARNRPYPDMIALAKRKFELTAADTVVKVGDSTIDIEEGKNAGCYLCMGITTGAQSREQLQAAQPDYIIDNLLDMLPLLEQR